VEVLLGVGENSEQGALNCKLKASGRCQLESMKEILQLNLQLWLFTSSPGVKNVKPFGNRRGTVSSSTSKTLQN